ncbi:tyrosine-type recombinase/integrase [Fictibacillus sp. 26RED30]|uniref:tyrosine-type recombinase/integrase n=1 Tax=Fictibacillus sp. 26RED30 TaxID=2745877 RepID=UPI0018CE455D|nr:tyrosine-type recombinase/integrase [Fictibacillus sp. 26RED30]MBH0159645.1 tyrosine-type recombinase/integrase [Fictibacillus sp. 26RED30]
MPEIKKINGYYRFRADIGPKGNRKQKRFKFKTKKEAQMVLAEILAAKHSGKFHEPSKLTVKEYFSEWLLNKRSIKNTTFLVYKNHIDNHIIPEMGNIHMIDINEYHIQSMFRKFDEVIPKVRKMKNETIYEKRLSNKTQSAIYKILKVVFNMAAKKNHIPSNPIEDVEAPSPISKEISPWNAKDAKIYHDYCVKAFIENEDCIALSQIIALSGGFRRGEILGLKWKNVVFDKNEIRIKSILDNKKTIQPTTKTRDSKRTVIMPPEVTQLLRTRLRTINRQKNMLGKAYNDNDLVICNEYGLPFHPDSIYKNLKRKALKLGLKPISFHALRHTHATLLLEKNVHPRIVSDRLGHSRVGITLDTYSHVGSSMQKLAADEITTVFYESKT